MDDRLLIATTARTVAMANDGIELTDDTAAAGYVLGALAALTWVLGWRDELPLTLDVLLTGSG